MLMYFHSGSELRVRAPHRRMPSPSKERRTLTPSWLSTPCAVVVDHRLQPDDAPHRVAGGRLEHAPLPVAPGVDPGHETRRRQDHAADGGLGHHPRVVEGGSPGVESLPEPAHVVDRAAGGGVDQGEAEPGPLGVGDEGGRGRGAVLDRPEGAGVGRRHQRDLVLPGQGVEGGLQGADAVATVARGRRPPGRRTGGGRR